MSPNTSSPRAESQLATDVLTAVGLLRVATFGLEPKEVPLPFAAEVFEAFCEAERFAQAGRLMMMARAGEARQWERSGFATRFATVSCRPRRRARSRMRRR